MGKILKKICSMCGHLLPLSAFSPDKRKPLGVKSGCKECANRINREKKHNLNVRYRGYKKRAKKKSWSFNLAMEQFRIISSKFCTYCGGFSGLSKDGPFSGIDRKNIKKGYSVQNCVPCCSVCNYMKNTMSKEEFLSHVARISSHQNNTGHVGEITNIQMLKQKE